MQWCKTKCDVHGLRVWVLALELIASSLTEITTTALRWRSVIRPFSMTRASCWSCHSATRMTRWHGQWPRTSTLTLTCCSSSRLKGGWSAWVKGEHAMRKTGKIVTVPLCISVGTEMVPAILSDAHLMVYSKTSSCTSDPSRPEKSTISRWGVGASGLLADRATWQLRHLVCIVLFCVLQLSIRVDQLENKRQFKCSWVNGKLKEEVGRQFV